MAAPKALTEGVKPQRRDVKRVATPLEGAKDSLWVAELLTPPPPDGGLVWWWWVVEPFDPLGPSLRSGHLPLRWRKKWRGRKKSGGSESAGRSYTSWTMSASAKIGGTSRLRNLAYSSGGTLISAR